MNGERQIRSTTEFGQRRPAPIPPVPGPKRSNHVALLVMGTLAVGGGAYALVPGASCQPTPAGAAAPGIPQANAGCVSRGSSGGSGGGYGGSSRDSFFGNSSSRGSSTGPGAESSSGVTRGGFGSFARAFGFGGG
jgi:hypothetical protein